MKYQSSLGLIKNSSYIHATDENFHLVENIFFRNLQSVGQITTSREHILQELTASISNYNQ